MNRLVEIHLKNGYEIHRLANKLDGFIFHGQADSHWELKTSIQRSNIGVNLCHVVQGGLMEA